MLLQHTLTDQAATVRTGLGVTVELHPGPPQELGLRQPPASKEARMNNVLRNYT
jgi:hypothetical protein